MKSIRLSNNIYVHVFLHEIKRTMEEFVLSSEECNLPDYKKEAEEYINALEEHYCVAFLEAIHEVSAKKIVEHWKEFSPEKLKDKRNQIYLKTIEK